MKLFLVQILDGLVGVLPPVHTDVSAPYRHKIISFKKTSNSRSRNLLTSGRDEMDGLHSPDLAEHVGEVVLGHQLREMSDPQGRGAD